MNHTFLLLTLVALLLGMMWQREKEKHSCFYCGRYRTHEPQCPYERVENID